MKRIWDYVDAGNMETNKKNTLFLLIFAGGCVSCGALVWILIGRFLPEGTAGAFCFVGYPAVVGFIAGILYLYNHGFEEKTKENFD